MSSHAVEEYLKGKGCEVFPAAGGRELTLQCLFCGENHRKGKLYVNAESAAFQCKVCGHSGGWKTLLEHFGDEWDDEAPIARTSRRLQIHEEYLTLAEQALWANERAVNFWRERGLSEQTIREFRLGYHPQGWSLVDSMPNAGKPGGYTRAEIRETGLLNERGDEFLEGRLIIPYLSSRSVMQLRGRQFDKKSEWGGKYVTPPGSEVMLFNSDALRGAEHVWLAEGEADAMIVHQHLKSAPDVKGRRFAVVAIPGVEALPGGRKGFPKYFENAKRVYVALDTDDTGRRAALEVRDVIGSHARILDYGKGFEDASDFLAPRTAENPDGGRDWQDLLRLVTETDMRNKRIFSVEEAAAQLYALEHGRPGIKLGWPTLDALISPGIYPGAVVVPLAKTGVGKAQPLSEPVLTPQGWTAMGDLAPGDLVIGSDGAPTRVLGTYPQGVQDVYRVGFSDGSFTYATGDHLWQAHTALMKFQSQSPRVMTTLELKERLADPKGWFIPTLAGPVRYEATTPLPVDPYTLGVILGDGNLTTSTVRLSTDAQIATSLVLPPDCSLSPRASQRGSCMDVSVLRMGRHLRALGLMGAPSEGKFIPEGYLRSSVEDRIALLQGLLDTDGSPVKGRHGPGANVEWGTVSRLLVDGMRDLVEGLGGVMTVKTKQPSYTYRGEKRDGQLYYRCVITFPEGIVPFRLERKRQRWTPPTKYFPVRRVASVEYSHREEAQCIRVAAPDSLYVTRHHVVTHNTVLLTQIAWANRHRPTLFVSLELTAPEVWNRMRRTARFYEPAMTEEQHFGLLPQLRLMDENRMRSSDFEHLLDEFTEEVGQPPELVLIDYLGYYARGASGRDQYERMTNATMELKALAKEFEVAVITPGQVNRSAKSGEPIDLDSARDSGAVEETADFMFGVWRPWESEDIAAAGKPGAVQSELTVRILKSRRGNKGRQATLHMSHASLVVVDGSDRIATNRVQQENAWVNQGETYEQIYQRQRRRALAEAQGQLPPWER